MADNETTTDIIAEKRRLAEHIRNNLSTVPVRQWDQHAEIKSLEDEADRLEAALERERGDAAKLREVCEKMLDLLTAEGFEDGGMSIELDEKQVIMWRTRFRAALSAQPRNCDVLKLKEGHPGDIADQVWRAYKQSHMGSYLDVCDLLRCIGWLLSPATEKEGGGK